MSVIAGSKETSINLLDLDLQGLEALFVRWGEPRFRSNQLAQWVHQKDERNFAAMSNLSRSLRTRLSDETCLEEPDVDVRQQSADGTVKWLLRLSDGQGIETVYIPEKDRGTLCISSQVGCALDCQFCATARQGFGRNLTLSEIIGQFRLARREIDDQAITNIVFMGMGEPLLNYRNVLSACNLLQHDLAYGLSNRKVTISTAGLAPLIEKLGQDDGPALAISLHATRNDIRDQIVPLNKKYPIEAVLDACRTYPLGSRRRITFEYVLLEGINDHPDHAKELAKLLQGIPSKINLIPFNPFPGAPFRRPSDARIETFKEIVHAKGLTVIVRRPRGEDIAAACGQLAGQVQERRKFRNIPITTMAQP